MSRRVLFGLCVAQAVALFATESIWDPGFWLLLALNALAVVGLATRTRAGWVAALACVLVGTIHWASGLDESGGLLILLAMAAAVFCVADPSLRREHGIAA